MFKPLLAGTMHNMNLIKYPLIASPKLDGIRTLILDGKAVTRSLKPIPNRIMNAFLSNVELEGLDGELVIGGLDTPEEFNATQSIVMSGSAPVADWTYVVFDSFNRPNAGYESRFEDVKRQAASPFHSAHIQVIENKVINNYGELLDYEDWALTKGYEGVMLRDPNGPYKFGRSTERAGTLVKMKQFADAEAIVTGYELLLHNNNVATTNVFGRTERTSHKAGKDADEFQVGALVVEGLNNGFEGVSFKIGTGFTLAQREDLARQGSRLVGLTVNYTYQHEGSKDAPRFPRFRGFRDPEDMS